MVHAVTEHRVQPAVQHDKHAHRHAEQKPALWVPGLTPGHQHPHQTADQAGRHGGTIAGDLQVAGERGQQHPGGDKRQAERAEGRDRH